MSHDSTIQKHVVRRLPIYFDFFGIQVHDPYFGDPNLSIALQFHSTIISEAGIRHFEGMCSAKPLRHRTQHAQGAGRNGDLLVRIEPPLFLILPELGYELPRRR